MSLPAPIDFLSPDDYLRDEASSQVRHEYVAGHVYAMAGAGEAHNRISLNIAFHLRSATRGTPCAVFISDMKVRVAAHDAFYYPDVSMTCDPDDRESLYKELPCLVVEVLSPSTELIDRREKLIAYRSLASLRYYLLVSQDRRLIEIHDLRPDGGWRHRILDGEGELEIQCDLSIRLSMTDIYEDVMLSPLG